MTMYVVGWVPGGVGGTRVVGWVPGYWVLGGGTRGGYWVWPLLSLGSLLISVFSVPGSRLCRHRGAVTGGILLGCLSSVGP